MPGRRVLDPGYSISDRLSAGAVLWLGGLRTHERDWSAAVRLGLGRARKTLPSHYLYDALGSALFEAITELPEYGLTRAEELILERHAAKITFELLRKAGSQAPARQERR